MLDLLVAILDVYMIVLLVRVVFTWMPPRARANQFYEFLRQITDPVIEPFRRLVPPMGGIDFSPLVPMLILGLIRHVLTRLH